MQKGAGDAPMPLYKNRRRHVKGGPVNKRKAGLASCSPSPSSQSSHQASSPEPVTPHERDLAYSRSFKDAAEMFLRLYVWPNLKAFVELPSDRSVQQFGDYIAIVEDGDEGKAFLVELKMQRRFFPSIFFEIRDGTYDGWGCSSRAEYILYGFEREDGSVTFVFCSLRALRAAYEKGEWTIKKSRSVTIDGLPKVTRGAVIPIEAIEGVITGEIHLDDLL
jgi:hypothetical protein